MTQEVPLNERYFEDYLPGQVYEFGSEAMTEEAIIRFARQYDPQPFHMDRQLAEESLFGELIASGWHTASVAMRMLVDNYLSTVASIVSPGIDELRWLGPVRPGDVLSLRVTVMDTRPSGSKPDRGIIRSNMEVLNQHREVVLSMQGLNLMKKRPPG